ncbi:ABC transporter substrate-binding protein [Haladaptatus halobius]|uniref:ABC transporter substrate-binding protein n=1 Tax=Haladaptatus halobius TaxID=2884875 RepID=UPI001D09ABD3|nr:ABC transporter substrate-binding protein [Haladaptatus halobius]
MSEKSNVTRRRFLKATGGAASAVALTGMAGTSGAQQSNQQGSDRTLQLINSTMSTLDPIKATDTASGTVIQQVFDPLMNYPEGKIAVENLLAESQEVSDNFTTYTFTLKQGAQFHNGKEVTAQDFVYSWERLAASENSRRSYFILDSIGVRHQTDGDGNYRPGSLAVNARDKYTLEMELKEPFHSTLEMLSYTSFAAIPEGLVGDVQGYQGEMPYQRFATSNPIGAGPFEFDHWSSNNEAVVTRFDNYHRGRADVAGVRWSIIEDDQAAYTYLMNQNADIGFNEQIPTAQYDPSKVTIQNTDQLGRKSGTYGPVQNGETMNYLAVPTINAFYLGFNTSTVEKPARQAAAYALNQQVAVDQVFKGRGEAAYHFTPPRIYPGGANAYDQHAQNNYPYGYDETQLQQARQVMEQAGYGNNNRYQFTLTTYESTTWQEIAKILRDQLQAAYIDLQLEQAPFSVLLNRGRSGNLQAYTLGWIMDWPAPDNFLQLLYPPRTDTSQSDPLAYTNWSGTQAANQATQAWNRIQNNPAPTDQAERTRNRAYVQIEEANWEDVTFLPVYHRTDERFSYRSISIPKFGAAGASRQMYDTTT